MIHKDEKRATTPVKKFFILSFLFSFLVFFPLYGKVNLSKSSADSKWPAIAVNSAGEIMVVWTEWTTGQIFYSINRNGSWTSPKNSNLDVQQAWSNQMVADSYGTFHITTADGAGSHTRDIAYSFFTGSHWSQVEKVYLSPYNSAWNKMAVDKNNDIHVIWYHSNVPKDAPYSSDVVTNWKRRMGTWPNNYQNISRNRSTESIHPAIAVLNGRVYASWMEDASPRRLYFSEKVGGSWSPPREILAPGYYPDMTADDSGNVHIVYSLKDGNFYYVSRIGGTWRSKEIISNGISPLQFGDIAHKNNVIVASWIQGSDSNWSVYATAKVIGDKWTIPVKVADAPGGGDGNKHVQVALDDRNCAHFIWEGIGQGGRNDIFYEKICVDTPKDATFIEVDNSYLSFHTDNPSSNPAARSFKIRASGAGSINYTLTKNKNWISLSKTQGSSSGEWDTIAVNVDASGMADGTYDGRITITDPSAYNNPVDVGVTLTVGETDGGGGGGGGDGGGGDSSFLETDKASLEFSMEEGINPASKSFNLRATGGKNLNYSVSTNMHWLDAYPEEGTVSSGWAPVAVSIEADNLQPGNFKGRVDIAAPGAVGKASVFINLTVRKKSIPSIQLSKTRFYFWGYAHGDNPPSSLLKIRNSGSKTMNYALTSNKDWVKFSLSKGASTGEWDDIVVFADSTALPAGGHKATITVSASGADNSPQNLPVDFEVEMPPQPFPPVGITVKRLNHEGLIIQEYKSKVEWSANFRNNGLFDIVKYRIFRKHQYQHNAPWIYIAEVPGNVFIFYEGGFASKEERNQYTYTVASVDSGGKESARAEYLGTIENLPETSPEQKNDKAKSIKKKIKNP